MRLAYCGEADAGSYGLKCACFVMRYKCANPKCSENIRNMNQGNLWLLEAMPSWFHVRVDPPAEVMAKVHGLHGLRYAWLCHNCGRSLGVEPAKRVLQKIAKAA